MQKKRFDIVGLGSCGIDYVTSVASFADAHTKVTCDNVSLHGGGVTANNLVQAARLWLRTAWCGALGKDDIGKHLLKTFKENHIAAVSQWFDKSQCCWIIVDQHGDRQIYVFPNAASQLTPTMVEKRFKRAIAQARHFHTEIAVIPLAAAIHGAEIAREAKAMVFLDVDGDIDYLTGVAKVGTQAEVERLLRLADVIKLSEAAAKQLAQENTLEAAMRDLLQHTKIVAVTLGKNGCIIANKQETVRCFAFPVSCVDSTGAGDAFMGGLSYALLKGMPLREAGMFANACGAYACTQAGARGMGKLSDIQALMKKKQ